MAKRLDNSVLRWPDDLREALQRFVRDLEVALGRWNNRFDPNDPRLVTLLLAALAGFLAFILLAALLIGPS
jgi:hypothetical protein